MLKILLALQAYKDTNLVYRYALEKYAGWLTASKSLAENSSLLSKKPRVRVR